MSGMMSRPGGAARPSPWVVLPKPNPAARLRLFCFPYAGGGASIYAPWGRMLPPEVEVVAVQLPGRENRIGEPAISDMRELTARFGEVLAPFMDRPFAFFGHSNGGLMAFELTRLLRREGRTGPVHLITAGRPAPQANVESPVLYNLPENEFRDNLRRFNGTPEEVLQNEEIMSLITPMLRADFSLGETYVYYPEPPLATPLSAYGGVGDTEVPAWAIEQWQEEAAGPFRVKMFPGGHFFLNENREQVLAEVTADLRGALARIGASPAHA
ncbi:MAG TPA: alpha/beta fold hydrolase [Longimicrobium sp.]|nr:alpha/beta fold hydrolase [Longimicrobium sp.]